MRIKVSEVATPLPRNMTKLHQIKVSGDFKALPEGFWSAVDVWIKKPHVVNKRLCGAKETESRYVDAAELGLILQSHGENSTDSDVFSFLRNSSEPIDGQKKQWSYSVRSLITKVNCYGENMHKDLVLKDICCQRVTFIPIQENAEGQTFQKKGNIYQIQLHDYGCAEWFLELHAFRPEEWFSDGVAYPKLPWMSRELLPKLVRWATESRTSEFVDTLSLLPVEKYSLMYQQLKNKYKEMVQVWPEVTNPEKFVYEDVAIATYLLVLWGEEREENGLTAKQSFVDLGCGNGLLVHILSNEGHPGKGIDVRRRKIWDMYGPETLLEEAAITPSDCFLFPATDWLIGNHSDELTPWIPVVAARSSYACRYFVLPCCFFDFNAKYQRRRCKKSQYREYVDFIAEVSAVSGFHTEEDCLRIPSTKRVCLVGKSRNYTPTAEPRVEAQRARYIQARMTRHRSEGPRAEAEGHHDDREAAGAAAPGNDWGTGFQPRERTEAVRNCAALPRDFIDGVVLQVANALLALNKEKDGGGLPSWNRGGTLSVREVADLLEQETLQVLKNECGGLQTLLKNNHQVFRVHGGAVQIRDWRPRDGVVVEAEARRQPPAPGTTKTRACWFHAHHPTGCPLPTEDCAFAHGAADLRPSTRPLRKKKNAPH